MALNVLQILEKAFAEHGVDRKTNQVLQKSFDSLLTEHGFKGQTADQWMLKLAENNPFLAKSMGIEANSSQTIGGTGALQLENLDPLMTRILLSEADLLKFKNIPRTPSPNVFPEWNRKDSYGSPRTQGGFREGSKPRGGVAKYTRATDRIRYIGEEGGVTHQASLSSGGMQVSPEAEEEENTAMRMFEKIERSILHGDSRILDEDGADVNYDGIIRQLEVKRPASIIDMEGQPLDYEKIQEFARTLRVDAKLPNFSKLRGHADPEVMSYLGNLSLEKERTTLGAPKSVVVPGTPWSGFQTQHGFMPFETDIVMNAVDTNAPLAESQLGAPVAPATVTGAAAATAGAEVSKLPAGTYYYFVSAINNVGESITTVTTGVVATLAQKITLTIARVTGATGYRVYRGTSTTVANARYIGMVPQTVSGSASFVDFNGVRPNTGTFLLYNADPQDLTIFQLAPLTKFPLAIVDTTVKFLLLMYHTLTVKAAERIIYVKNIGLTTP